MSKHERHQKLVGPWRKLHAAVWLIGLAILAIFDWWWPGILVLVAISLIIEAVLMKVAPYAFEEEEDASTLPAGPPSQPSAPAEPATPITASPAADHRAELLPTNCPKCGAPTRGHEVKWTGPQSADCSFCGANLPMGK